MENIALELKGITKTFGKVVANKNINLTVKKGEILSLLGENGSGKTTIMRLVSGLANPTSGEYSLFGINFKDRKIYQARKQVSAIVETVSLVPSLTAKQNMIYQELYEGIKLSEEEREALLKKVNLADVENKKVKNYSLGMRQRLGIALALMSKPKLMFLDEPMNGLDPEGIAELRDLLIELNQKDGITVLISSHILSELEKIASCYGFISKGKLIEEISAEELQKRCKKSLNLKVGNLDAAKEILANLKLKDVNIYPNGEIKIYDDIKVNKVVMAFDKAGVELLGIHTSEGSVEDYYLDLVKGGQE